MLLLPEEQMGKALEPFKKECSFENWGSLDGRVFSLVSVFERLNICDPLPEVTDAYPHTNIRRHRNIKQTRT